MTQFSHLPASSFPSSSWDGLTANRTHAADNKNPNDADWDRMTAEVRAMQEQTNALYTRLTAGDNMELVNSVWDDMQFPVTAVKLSGTKPPTWTDYKGGQVLAFSDQATEGNEEIVYFNVQMPHGYKEGSSITPHVHWVGEDNTAGNVAWKLSYSWANFDSAFPSETEEAIIGANGETDIQNTAGFTAISGTGKTMSSMLICSLRRFSSDASDTFTSKDAYLLEVDVHVELNRFGSRLAWGH
jgi:hypothetical protein